jgi:16S rRNA (uracil1498-N3)-methyltransferase
LTRSIAARGECDDNLGDVPPRFFVPDLDPSRAETVINKEEAQHLTRVLRLGTGDEILVFDGRGHQFLARVASVARSAVRVELVSPSPAAREPRVRVTLAQAVLKAEKMDHVVRDATMMGAAAIVPLITSRTVVPRRAAGAAAERWSRVAIASAKQCGRAVVPDVGEARALEAWLREDAAERKLVLVEPEAAGARAERQDLRELDTPRTASILVGPEGGWTVEEIDSAVSAGFLPVTFGARTLRADAIPIIALSILLFLWDEGTGSSEG